MEVLAVRHASPCAVQSSCKRVPDLEGGEQRPTLPVCGGDGRQISRPQAGLAVLDHRDQVPRDVGMVQELQLSENPQLACLAESLSDDVHLDAIAIDYMGLIYQTECPGTDYDGNDPHGRNARRNVYD